MRKSIIGIYGGKGVVKSAANFESAKKQAQIYAESTGASGCYIRQPSYQELVARALGKL